MHITFVKKVLNSGAVCAQCQTVYAQLINDGLLEQINHVAIIDSRDKQSPGAVLATQHQVKQVPFFIVQDLSGQTDERIFDNYATFKAFVTPLITQ